MCPHANRLALLTATASLLVSASVAAAQPFPQIDASFGTQGFARTDFQSGSNDEPFAMMVQPDGRILCAGISRASSFDWFLAITRHTAEGVPDPDFGTNGKVVRRFDLRDQANALALQPDGRIVAAGMQAASNAGSAQIPSIYRMNADGSIDSSFSDDGVWAARFEPVSSGEIGGVMVTPHGKILVAGRLNANANGGHNGFAFRRLMPDGSSDNSYGSFGSAIFHSSPTVPQVGFVRPAVAFTPEGGALMASIGFDAADSRTEPLLMRVDSAGTPVPFASGTTLFPNVQMNSNLIGLKRLADDGFVLAGSALNPSAPTQTIVSVFRFLSDGTPDPGFGTGGRADVVLGTTSYTFTGMTVAPDGAIVVAAKLAGAALLARLTPDGQPDPGFGTDGIATLDVSQFSGTGYLNAFLHPAPDLLLGTGYDFTVNAGDFVLTRLQVAQTVAVDDGTGPAGFAFAAPVPNPSRGEAMFAFELPHAGRASLEVFDAAGRRVATLADGVHSAGRHTVRWRFDDAGATPASGAYFVRLSARDEAGAVLYRETRRLLRVR